MEDETMSKYQEMKRKTRNEAIDWQHDFPNHSYSWGEVADWAGYFERLGRRYGLLTEFRENGIC
jgi:hypothetical protein